MASFADTYYEEEGSESKTTFREKHSYFSRGHSCFTENYLVFSLQERMPQMTEIFLDKEDDLLDYCKRIVFRQS